jgi:hypothetical protein
MDCSGWVDGAPTRSAGQSCAFCGEAPISWVHPLDASLVRYREYGKGHTLPTFWCLCESCELTYRSGDDDAAVVRMRSADPWALVADGDVEERIRQPLAVFRRADRGPRRVSD